MNFMDSGQPNCTLYLQNLNEKIKPKTLIPELEKIFSEYGKVYAVISKKRLALKGQAFVIFEDLESAKKAWQDMQGVRLWGKTVIVRYSRYKSDYISKRDGTYEIEKRRREQDQMEKAKRPRLTRRQIMAQMAANPMAMTSPGMIFPMGMQSPPIPLQAQMFGGELQLPNKTLYIQNIPTGAKEETLIRAFKMYPGYIEIRLVPNRPDLAFAEYETEGQSGLARQALDNTSIIEGQPPIRVSFAKR